MATQLIDTCGLRLHVIASAELTRYGDRFFPELDDCELVDPGTFHRFYGRAWADLTEDEQAQAAEAAFTQYLDVRVDALDYEPEEEWSGR